MLLIIIFRLIVTPVIDNLSFYLFISLTPFFFLICRHQLVFPSLASDACIEFKVFRVILFCRENLPNALLDPLPTLQARTTSRPHTVTLQLWR